MTTKLSLVSTFILVGTVSAHAQTPAAPAAPAPAAAAPTTPEPTSKTVATDVQGRSLIGAQLQYNPAVTAADGDPETLYFLNQGTVKQTGAWGEEDRKACEASGGIEIPLPAGRVACVRL